jgi:WD40 repeat protein
MTFLLARLALVLLLPPMDAHGDPLPPGARARLGTVRWRHGGPVSALGFTADGMGLATLSEDGAVRLWERFSGRLRWMRQIIPFHYLTTSPTEPWLVVANAEGEVLVLGTEDGQVRHRWNLGRFCQGLALSPDGLYLALASPGDVRVYEVATGREVHRLPLPGGVTWLAFQPQGPLLAGAGPSVEGEPTVHLWDWAAGRWVRGLEAVANPPGAFTFSPDGRTLLASGPGEDRLRRWEVATGREIPSWPLGRKGVRALALAPDDQILAVLGEGFLDLRDVRTSAPRGPRLDLDSSLVAFSPDGKYLALCPGAGHHVELLGTAERPPRPPPRDPTGPIRGVAFDAAAGLIVTVGAGPTPYLWDVRTARPRDQAWRPGRLEGEALAGDWWGLAVPGENGPVLTWTDQAAVLWDFASGTYERFPRRVSPWYNSPGSWRRLSLDAGSPWIVLTNPSPPQHSRGPWRFRPGLGRSKTAPVVAQVLPWPARQPAWSARLPGE